MHVGAAVASGAASTAVAGAGGDATASPPAELLSIFANSFREGVLPPEDVRYAGQAVEQRTGLSKQDADKRVADTYNRMQSKPKSPQRKPRKSPLGIACAGRLLPRNDCVR